MKTLKHLERKKFVWFLIGLSIVFFLLRLPSLIEPYWYGDEGIYQVIGLAMNNGRDLYSEIWDNKPPLLYILYALFSGDQFSMRMLSLVFGIATTIIFFFLARLLLRDDKIAGGITALFTILFATPFLEGNIANAENFMVLLVVGAGYLVYKKTVTDKHLSQNVTFSIFHFQFSTFAAGLLLGTAFLLKIVAMFDLAALCLFLIISTYLGKKVTNKSTLLKNLTNFIIQAINSIFSLVCGFLIPITAMFVYFTLNGTLVPFLQSVFLGNVGYVGYANHFIFPQGLLILKVLLIALALFIIILKRHKLSQPALFISIWFVFTVFSAFFSQREYLHYILVILPTSCLVAGLLLTIKSLRVKLIGGILFLILVQAAMNHFHVYGVIKTVQYYENAVVFLFGGKSVSEYQTFFDPETPRDYELVAYINTRISKDDEIFLWGDSPQIYYLAKKFPLNKYTVSYHILQDPKGIVETQAAIDKIQPKFIITLSEAPQLPFQLPQYVGKYGIKGSTIYERTF